jgi:hypothetical protein
MGRVPKIVLLMKIAQWWRRLPSPPESRSAKPAIGRGFDRHQHNLRDTADLFHSCDRTRHARVLESVASNSLVRVGATEVSRPERRIHTVNAIDAIGRIGRVGSGLDRRVRCGICGFSEVRTDEVVDRGVLFLAECPRCDHRWTSAEPIAAAPTAAAALATVRFERVSPRFRREVQPAA